MHIDKLLRPSVGVGSPCPSPMMKFHDQSRYCHPERSEGSLCPSRETFRGVYPERSEWAQGDKTFPILVGKNHHRALYASLSKHRQIALQLPGMYLLPVLYPLHTLYLEERFIYRVTERLAYQAILAQAL